MFNGKYKPGYFFYINAKGPLGSSNK